YYPFSRNLLPKLYCSFALSLFVHSFFTRMSLAFPLIIFVCSFILHYQCHSLLITYLFPIHKYFSMSLFLNLCSFSYLFVSPSTNTYKKNSNTIVGVMFPLFSFLLHSFQSQMECY